MNRTGLLGVSLLLLFALLAVPAFGATEVPAQPDMPKGLWQAFSDARHMVEPVKGEVNRFKAQNPKNHLVFRFGEDGFTVKTGVAGQDWSLTMRLDAYGQEGALIPAGAAEFSTEGRKIEYRRDGITEWYVNNSGGLEQGFTVEKPESFDRTKPLVLSLDLVGGLVPTVQSGTDASFSRADGGHAFDYKGLKAFDGEGNRLPAELLLADGHLGIHVQVGNAPWPVRVDPVISTQAKVMGAHNDAAADDNFGKNVSVSGDTAVVGAPRDDDGVVDGGSAYVFVRSGSTWAFQAKLTAADAVSGDLFGYDISVSGDTVVIGAASTDDGGTDSGSAYVFVRSGGSWTQQQKLTASDAAAGDYFGRSVSVSGDTVVVGANNGDAGAVPNSGSAYVFVRSGGVWAEEQELTASDAATGDSFGFSVSVSGDTVVVGAQYDDDAGTSSGSAYVFVRSGVTWTQQQKLTASDAAAGDYFGKGVSVSGDTVVVGANNGDAGAVPNSGSAYVFVRSGGVWAEEQELTASDAATGDSFGFSVSVSGDTAVVGAILDNDAGTTSGSAYVFVRSGVTWTQQQKLTASDAAGGDEFGYGVAISGDTVVVSALLDDDGGTDSGSAYVFVRSGSTWSEEQKLTAVRTIAFDYFGQSVSISGDTAVIGANRDDDVELDSGAAYVFVRSGSTWSEQQKLKASDAFTVDDFGWSVSISGDTVVVGAPGDDVGAVGNCGSAYVFVRSGSTWSQQQKLTASDAAAGDYFGYSVSLWGDTAVIGARNTASNSGSAYVFVRPGSTWSQQQKLTASDAAAGDGFGSSVSLWGDTAVVGALWDDVVGADSGSVYVFVRSGSTWSQQQKLTASDAADGDSFGSSVSVWGDTAVVGALWDNVVGADSGSAYVFVRARTGNGLLETAKLTASDATAYDHFGSSVSLWGDTAVVGAAQADDGATDSGSAYLNRFECGFGGAVPPGRWTMIGIPCDLGTADTVQDVFGDNFLPSQYLSRWVLYKRDEATDRYVRLNLSSPLVQGEGYWLYSTNWGMWDASGTLTTYVESGLCTSAKGCFEVTLTSPASSTTHLWNLVGHPGNQTADWSGTGVLVDGTLYTPSDAELAGYVSKTIYKYNGGAYDSFDDGTPGMEGTLESQEGIWVEVLGGSSGHTIKLLIPNGETLGGPPAPPGFGLIEAPPTIKEPFPFLAWLANMIVTPAEAAAPVREDEWYVRIIAESAKEGLRDKGNVLGQLIGSSDGYDKRDLRELTPFAKPFLTIVFPHNDWGKQAGEYTSDYHAPSGKDMDQWIFQVKSDSPWRDVRLAWENIKLLQSVWSFTNNRREWTTHKSKSGESIMAKMWLEDMDTGDVIKVAEDGVPQDYVFNMNGETVRTFRWMLTGPGGKRPSPPSNRPESWDPASTAGTFDLPPNAMGNPPRVGQNK